jgi:hypothetical protein
MNTRTLTLIAATIVAAAVAGTAVAGSAAKDARKLVLRTSDFPAGTRKVRSTGNRVRYGATFRYVVGGRRNDLMSGASVLPNRAAALAAFREAKSNVDPNSMRLVLPKVGHDQFGSIELGTAQLVVRKNNVVWFLMLGRTGSTGSNADEIQVREASAELWKYASIQMRRVGNG